jgi:hypothetical protein
MEVPMIFRKETCACIALACALSLTAVPASLAQVPQPNDSTSWSAPRGYDMAYPENGTPNMVARQGYAAGFNQGQADLSRGQSFRPTENKAYAHAKIPKGMDKDQFKTEFRESFVKGYTNAYRGQ